MSIRAVQSDINQILPRWEGFLANPNHVQIKDAQTCHFTWTADLGVAWRGPLLVEHFEEILAKHQYSYQTYPDGSLLQMKYLFDVKSDLLLSASLAFLRCPPDYAEESERLEWIRLDYAPDHATGPSHCRTHLHVGGLTEARFPVCGVPTPSQFVELIALLFYADEYQEYVSKNIARRGAGLQARLDPNPEPFFVGIIHISVPTSQ